MIVYHASDMEVRSPEIRKTVHSLRTFFKRLPDSILHGRKLGFLCKAETSENEETQHIRV